MIAEDIENIGSYKWSLNAIQATDSLRIKIIESKANPACDINGHYIRITGNVRTAHKTEVSSVYQNLKSKIK